MAKRVTSLTHQDKRANIPTEELRDFVAEDEEHPTTVEYPGLLYARDTRTPVARTAVQGQGLFRQDSFSPHSAPATSSDTLPELA